MKVGIISDKSYKPHSYVFIDDGEWNGFKDQILPANWIVRRTRIDYMSVQPSNEEADPRLRS